MNLLGVKTWIHIQQDNEVIILPKEWSDFLQNFFFWTETDSKTKMYYLMTFSNIYNLMRESDDLSLSK